MSLHVSISVKVNPKVLKSLDVADKNNLLGRCTGRFDRAKMVYLQIIFNSSLLHGNEKGKMEFSRSEQKHWKAALQTHSASTQAKVKMVLLSKVAERGGWRRQSELSTEPLWALPERRQSFILNRHLEKTLIYAAQRYPFQRYPEQTDRKTGWLWGKIRRQM